MTDQRINHRRQIFSITLSHAANVLLVGDFTHWQETPIPLKRGTAGEWYRAVNLLPGSYLYRVIVDGQWCDDPKSTLSVPNPYGSRNSVRQVNGNATRLVRP
jgi:1,4-alpha-glucan branching enzyme